jgi:ferric-dicitrate binding protein FerR (iron transport regulator)
MSTNKIWDLFARKLSGEASTEELEELELLVEKDSKLYYELLATEDFWNKKQDSDEDQDYLEATYHLHREKMKKLGVCPQISDEVYDESIEQEKSFFARNKSRFAGALLLAGLLLWLLIFVPVEKKQAQGTLAGISATDLYEFSTRNGVKSKFILPDGSVVWLNAGSKLTYGKDFGLGKREVTLAGEGFFDVKKNTEKPFIISTSSINIRVLGTAFNVRAYPEDKNTETSLIRGSIELTIKSRPNDKIILSPNEKVIVQNTLAATYEKSAAVTEKPTVQAANTLISIKKLSINPIDSTVFETQWINNQLVFRDESFYELSQKMERWYNVKIEIKDESLGEERLTGIFKTESVYQALEALKESIVKPFQFRQTQDRIIIYR